jgi:hypothetical protein
MDKLEKRQQIENNLATKTLEKILEKKSKKINELTLLKTESLEGSLNLGILAEHGFSKIDTIRFAEGNITSITNIPEGLIRLSVPDNLLISLKSFPDSLEHLDVAQNILKGKLDISSLTLLKTLRVSFNQITEIIGLSETLEELYCDHNLLKSLSLNRTSQLKILHCDHNPNLKLTDLPSTLIDTKLPEKITQFNSISNRNQDGLSNVSDNYLESMDEYFQIKQEYDEKLMNFKKSKKQKHKLPNCIGCGKAVGMIFSGLHQKYEARCGNVQSCGWKIVIHRGDFHSFRETLEGMRENLEETKENIIRQKMDTLFQYISEEKSAELFEKQLAFFKNNTELIDSYTTQYNEMYFSDLKKTRIQEKQREIQEYLLKVQQYLEDDLIVEAVQTQVEKIAPATKKIQTYRYETMEVNYDEQKEEWKLVQNDTVLSKLEINHSTPPSVETHSDFKKKRKNQIELDEDDNNSIDEFFNQTSSLL